MQKTSVERCYSLVYINCMMCKYINHHTPLPLSCWAVIGVGCPSTETGVVQLACALFMWSNMGIMSCCR